MKLRTVCLFAAIIFFNGCSAVGDKYTSFMGGEDNATPPTPLEDIEQRVAVTRLWEKDAGDGYDEQYLKLIPVHAEGKIFVADSDGEIQAIDSLTGKIIWAQDTDAPITGGPGAGNNLVTAGTGKAEIITLSAETGEILWRSRVSSEVLAAPQVAGNIIIARTIDGKIFGLNAQDGQRLWIYERPVPVLTLRGTSSPVITGDYVIAGFDEGRLAAIELQTGKLIWETRVALGSGRSELERMVDIDSEPVVMEDTIYVATFQGRIAALALDSGRILWTREISSYAGLCADNKAVYITDDDSAVWALDRTTGASIWKQEKLLARAVTAPENFGNMVAVGDVEGYLHWLDKNTGEFVARKQVSDSKIIAPPISANDVVYAYASDGTISAYNSDQVNSDIVFESPAKVTESQSEDDDASMEEESALETEITEEPESETVDTETLSEQEEIAEHTESAEDSEEEEEKGFFGRLWDRMTTDEPEELVP